MNRIHLDHNETTRPDLAVREEMLSCLHNNFGNPSSVHSFGQEARRIVDEARKSISRLTGESAVLCVAALQVSEAFKIVVEANRSGHFLQILDVWSGSFTSRRVEKEDDCP